MAVSLSEAKNNAVDDIDVAVIDEFRKESTVLDALTFDDVVNPAGGGATLTYGYRRLVSQPTAAFRALNSNYDTGSVTTERYTVELAPLGGSFEVDRVIAKIGPSASGAVTLNMQQKVKATRTRFQDAVINGDVAGSEPDAANGFDGLDKALAGSSTEYGVGTSVDWTKVSSQDDSAHQALDELDEFLSLLDGSPTLILGNAKALARVRAIARRSGMYTRNPVNGLLGAGGRPIERETYGGITFADPGDKAGSSEPIIPVESRTIGSDTTATDGLTDLYAVRFALDGFHGVSIVGGQLVQTWLPDFSTAGAKKIGEVEFGPVGVALKATKAAAVFRNIKVQ